MNSDNEQEPLISSQFASVRPEQANYGSYELEQKSLNRKTDLSTALTYSWSNLNVFSMEQDNKKISFWKLFRKTNHFDVGKKHLLKNINGIAYPGEFLAILGPSGSGKTTLLNTLNFQQNQNLRMNGSMFLNGNEIYNRNYLKNCAYVQQFDLFYSCLTVKEHLTFQAMLRMEKDLLYHQRIQRVQDVMNELSLVQVQDVMIGSPGKIKGISGGELRRLSFASEILTDPLMLFCDEPTSGLDYFMALNIVLILKELCRKGKTIISTIHQPSSELYSYFDKILIMTEGRTAFLGTPADAKTFFEKIGAPCPSNYNPADYFIELVSIEPFREDSCRQAVEMICDQFEQSSFGRKIATEAISVDRNYWHNDYIFNCDEFERNPYKAKWTRQFSALLWRSWICFIKNPILIKTRFLQTILVAVLIGLIFFGQKIDANGVININSAIFLYLTNMTFQNVFSVINIFCTELPIFLQEHQNGMYRVDAYFISKTFAEIPFSVILPSLFTGISYFMIGLNSNYPKFWNALIVMVLVSNVANSFGYLISCISTSISMALSIGPPVIVPFLLFGGFLLNTAEIPIYFKSISYLSWFRFGNEALLINQWKGIDKIDCSLSNGTLCPKNGTIILESLNFSEDHFPMDIISLILLIIAFRFFAFLALLCKTIKF